MSIGSNIASSSGEDSSEGLPTCAWVSLTLEEQFTNFLSNFERIICRELLDEESLDASFLESIAKVVQALRIDLWVDIESLLCQIPEKYWALCRATPLHWAILMDDRTMVQYILTSKKIDINASKFFGVGTTLNCAIVGGNCALVEDLLEHKADVCIRSEYQRSALYYMVHHKDSMFGILRKVLADNINMYDVDMNTSLHYAAMEGAVDVVRYLLDQGADVNVHNGFEDTPLHCAAEKGSLDVVACLLQQNANVNASNGYGESPLHYAARSGDMNMISFLLEHNADIDALNLYGVSPLGYSIRSRKVDTFKELIANGANGDVKDEKDNNALHLGS